MTGESNSGLPANEHKRISEILQALASEKRIEILVVLSKKTMNVSELADVLGYDISDMSKNLQILRKCGMVRNIRNKKSHLQSIDPSKCVKVNKHIVHIEVPVKGRQVVSIDQILEPQTLRCLDSIAQVNKSSKSQAALR